MYRILESVVTNNISLQKSDDYGRFEAVCSDKQNHISFFNAVKYYGYLKVLSLLEEANASILDMVPDNLGDVRCY